MPKGPNGQKRTADVIGNAVHVMRIATGQVSDDYVPKDLIAAKRGRVGGLARAKALTPAKRKSVAKKAAKARWSN